MASPCGLKLLLLWAGIISLTNCQTPTTTSQSITSLPSPTKTETSVSPSITGLKPTLTTPTTTITSSPKPSVSSATTKAPPPTSECSYRVEPITFGFSITITRSIPGNYTIYIQKDGQLVRSESGVISGPTATKEIKHLQPCTEYYHQVEIITNSGKIVDCSATMNKLQTRQLREDEITESKCSDGLVCYRSDWDISSSLTTNYIKAQPCSKDRKIFCIKPEYNDICTNLNLTFTSEACVNSSFTITRHIDVEFLRPEDIAQNPQTKIPAKIEPNLPKNCADLNVTYTCWEKGNLSKPKDVSMLEPFIDYSCIGDVVYKNKSITNMTAVNVKIDCNPEIRQTVQTKKTNTTENSFCFSWRTVSENCGDMLSNLHNLSYNCMCSSDHKNTNDGRATRWPEGGLCCVSGLKSFTDYTCKVQPTYNNQDVGRLGTVRLKTDAGEPDKPPELKVTHLGNNVIKVYCEPIRNFNGPKQLYIAHLSYDGAEISKKNNTSCHFEFDDLSYSTSYTVTVKTFNGKRLSMATMTNATTSYNDKALIGVLVFLIILTCVALLFVTYRIYVLKRRMTHGMNEHMMLIPGTTNENNLLTLEPIAAEVLLETYKRKLADEGRLFLDEFQSIPKIFFRYSMKEAKKPCNAPKNRYMDILPFDYNRVLLTTGNGDTGCDYINASFIDGYKESKKYIATQGPKEETVSDFWRMIWEQQSSIIVMVTRLEEGNRVKCVQYWPEEVKDTKNFEEFIVKLTSEDHCPDYTIRHLSLNNKREKNSEREVTHIQFMSWPDHGIPEEAHLLLKLRRRVNAFKNFFSGPIVIHCSAGVGRTGTYIGIDAMMEGLEAEGKVDIYGYVVRLRRQRSLMVQVESQYILIHQALLEHNQFGETEIALPELHSTLNMLRENSGNEPTLLEDEFERLPTFKNWRTCKTGTREENEKKNRTPSVVPYDYNRVMLKMGEGHSRDSNEEGEEESSDEEDEEPTKYINASYINGYWGPCTFITAQTPLPDTVADFWSMVYQKRPSAIVMLSDYKEEDKGSVYWDEKTLEDFQVEVSSTDTTPTFIRRNMLIRHVKRKESRPVTHFQFLKWENREVPEKPQDLTDMIKVIKHSFGSGKSWSGESVVVHCNDGSSRSGVFCALWNLLDSADTEKLVDVFQVAKTLRKERHGMISSLEQYQFLYDALEGVYPLQNGEVKAVPASAEDSLHIVDETAVADQPASTTSNDQQEAAPREAGGKAENKEPEEDSETTSPEDSTGPTAED
ncbi:receptor-type tyrosine-protein phosphatase C isoform X2 [Antennarius striatus]|uniref:receptor-type tyrosine-protein phosphatase C isoform X2 n=1 Tax=Antennarius striatus TaxID=241820 RepID=UPI0035AFDD1D